MWCDAIAVAAGYVDRGVHLLKEKLMLFVFFLSPFYPFASKLYQANCSPTHLEKFSLHFTSIALLCPSSSARVDQNNLGAYVPIRFNV